MKNTKTGTLIQVRLNDDLLEKLDTLAKTIGGNRTTAIRFMIEKYRLELRLVDVTLANGE